MSSVGDDQENNTANTGLNGDSLNRDRNMSVNSSGENMKVQNDDVVENTEAGKQEDPQEPVNIEDQS